MKVTKQTPIAPEFSSVVLERPVTLEALAEAIAARTGTDLEQDMYPRILAGAVIAAARVAVRRRSAADGLLGDVGGWVNEEEFTVPAGPGD